MIQNIAPIVQTRIGDEQMHGNPATQRLQRLHIAGRQGRDAKDEDARRQTITTDLRRGQGVDKFLVEIGSVIPGRRQLQGAGHQLAPQLGLPMLALDAAQFSPQPLTLLPAGNPVGTVDQVLVKEIGYLLAELP